MRRLFRPFWILLALIFMAEAWLWDRLSVVMARLVAALPLQRLKSWLSARLQLLSPRMTVLVLAAPLSLAVPLKFAEVWLLMHGRWLDAILLIVVTKLVGVGITAFIFNETRAKLLQLNWFCALYRFVLRVYALADRISRPIRQEIHLWIAQLKTRRADQQFVEPALPSSSPPGPHRLPARLKLPGQAPSSFYRLILEFGASPTELSGRRRLLPPRFLRLSRRSLMSYRILPARWLLAAALLLAAPLAAQAQGIVRGADQGARDGEDAAGPVGAIVGGVVGGVAGGVAGVLGLEDRPRFRSYVIEENRPVFSYDGDVAIGVELPSRGVEFYPVPPQYGPTNYVYSRINGQTVIVDTRTRRIVELVN